MLPQHKMSVVKQLFLWPFHSKYYTYDKGREKAKEK